jgi:hypothetical protein
VIAGALLSEVITKRNLMLATVLVNISGLVIALVAPTLFTASVGLFINFAAKSIQMELIMCFITEAVAEIIRGKQTIFIYITFGSGATLNGLFFYAISNWEVVLVVCDLLPLLMGLAGLLFYIEETPFDLIINNTPEKSLESLKTIAARNDKPDHDLTLE